MPKPFNIAVDVRDLHKAFSGTKTYLASLVEVWKKNRDPRLQFVFLGDFCNVYTGNNKLFKALEHIKFFYWKQISLPFLVRKHDCSILFCTDYFLPFFQWRFQTVVVFHDAFFFEYPEHYNRIWLKLFKHIAIPAAEKAITIIVPSGYAKQRIQLFTGFTDDQLKVVYEAPSLFTGHQDLPIHNSTLKNIIKEKYILHAGTFNKNKNLVRLINAFKKLVDANPDQQLFLVLAGKASPHSALNDQENIIRAIEVNNLNNTVLFTGFLNEADLAAAYMHALFYVFPSFNEGFGIPAVEAFKYQVPLLAANNTCLPEIASDAALYFNPLNEIEMTEKMLLLLKNKELRNDLIEKGNRRLKDFSWEKTSAELNNIFIENINYD